MWGLRRYIAAMRRKSCNRTSFPSYATMSIKRQLCYVRTLKRCKIKCMSYFYARNSQHGLVNSYIGEYIIPHAPLSLAEQQSDSNFGLLSF